MSVKRDQFNATALCIFAKTPIRGAVKTRLARTIGIDAALQWYIRMVWRTLSHLSAYTHGPIKIYATPEANHTFFQYCQHYFGYPVLAQQGLDLGARMHNAVRAELKKHRAVMIIGTDCPALDLTYLNEAHQALSHADCVLGPALDGGYVLIGMHDPCNVFQHISWGSTEVLKQTRLQLEQNGWVWHELSPLLDIDHEQDLFHYAEVLRKVRLPEEIRKIVC